MGDAELNATVVRVRCLFCLPSLAPARYNVFVPPGIETRLDSNPSWFNLLITSWTWFRIHKTMNFIRGKEFKAGQTLELVLEKGFVSI